MLTTKKMLDFKCYYIAYNNKTISNQGTVAPLRTLPPWNMEGVFIRFFYRKGSEFIHIDSINMLVDNGYIAYR